MVINNNYIYNLDINVLDHVLANLLKAHSATVPAFMTGPGLLCARGYINKVVEHNSAHHFYCIRFSCKTNKNGDMRHLILREGRHVGGTHRLPGS